MAVLSGLLLTASFPNAGLSYLAWVALVPFFLAVEGRGWRETLLIAYAAGVSYYWSLFYWLNNVTVAGFFVLTLYLALYFPLFAAGMRFFRGRIPVAPWLLAPVFWTALEYVRTYAFTGLPWGLVGVSQHDAISLIQVAGITGVYGVSFIVVLVNAVVYECIHRRGRRCVTPVLATALVLAGCIVYGRWWVRLGDASEGSVRVGIVQGNVPQEEKFGSGFKEDILKRFCVLTLQVARRDPDLILWPETSVPGYYWYDPVIRPVLRGLQGRIKTPIVLGSNHVSDLSDPKFFNSAFLVGPDGEAVARYDKIHLVLFGEIVPCKRFFPFLMKMVPYEEDFTPGEEFTVFPLPKADFGTLICFEDIFPDLARGFVSRGARFLVNITNDAWFGRSSQPYLHVAHAVFRCVENSVGMARATNSGVSCFIDPYGRITEVLRNGAGEEIFVAGTAVGEVPLSRVSSFYTRWGNLFAIACLAATALAFGFACLKKRKRE